MDSLSEIKKHIEFLTYRKLQNSKTRSLCTSRMARKFQTKKHRGIVGSRIGRKEKEKITKENTSKGGLFLFLFYRSTNLSDIPR